MKSANIDCGMEPRLNLAEIGAKLGTHDPGLGRVVLALGDDEILRANERPLLPLVHHSQTRTVMLLVADLEPELKNHQLVNAVIAEFLWKNPSFIPKNWQSQLDIDGIGNPSAGGGLIFWGTTVVQISGRTGLPVLQQLEGNVLVSVIDKERVVGLKASAILI